MNKDLVRFRHMLDSIEAVLEFVKNKSRSDLDSNRMLFSAIVREFEILGEAAGKISQKMRDQYPELPWRQVIGMRNRLIHGYFDINHDTMWLTIHQALPALRAQVEKVIADIETTS